MTLRNVFIAVLLISFHQEIFAQGFSRSDKDFLLTSIVDPKPLEQIKVSGKKFAGAVSGKEFVPLGFNYDRDYKSRLIEDYWNSEWQTVVEDFREMKKLGANV